jgi:acetyltransferase
MFFHPKTVAVIGATEAPGSVGRTVLQNLLNTPFGGQVFPVNPKRARVLDVPACPSIGAVPEPVDLAVIVTPAQHVPAVVHECVEARVPGAVIISAGFKETGAAGAAMEQQILAAARRGNMRLIGPNCLGVMQPLSGLNATFASTMARPGNVAFISQSGALCTAVLDWSMREQIGFSSFISIGSMLDVGWGDLIDYLGNDPQTKSIIMYMETVGDARAFLSAAREVALSKPILVIKAGRTAQAAKAAASHTGSLAGSDEVLDAAFKRCGVLRVNAIGDLFALAEVLAMQPRPRGPRLTILTNAGGPGVLATDALVTSGGALALLSPETMAELDAMLPPHWSHNNPVDILGDAGSERYAKAAEIVARDPQSDGLLVVLTPQAMTDPTATAEQLKPYAHSPGKPILASWMGGPEVAAGEAILQHAGIPNFAYPDDAARTFQYMWHYSENLRSLYETPTLPTDDHAPQRQHVEQLIQVARNAGRTILNEVESKQMLAAYGIPTVETRVATTENEAVLLAGQIGFPVVLKLYSQTITHKTDVGGVQLNLGTERAVRRAFNAITDAVRARAGIEHFQGVTVQPMVSTNGYELILGSSLDPQFGPVLLFGAGGQLVEVMRDRALALPPLNTTLARRLMEQTRMYTALKGVRGRAPVDLAALEQLIVRFSELVAEQPWIKEIDINPLLVSSEGMTALDARVILHDPDTALDKLPKLAIRPYPTQYVAPWTLKNGMPITIRPIRPEDEPLMVDFHETLSAQSVYLRYFRPLALDWRVTHERLTRICFNDYDREIALVADQRDPATGKHYILAVGRLSKDRDAHNGEFALLISDVCQKQGLGTELLRRLLDVGRAEQLEQLVGYILPENQPMLAICRRLGFTITHDGQMLRAVKNLEKAS